MSPVSNEAIALDVENIHRELDRVDRIMDKLEDNSAKLTVLCAEIKAMSEMQTRKMDHMEQDHNRQRIEVNEDKTEFNRSVARIHDKIESSEEKNEKKIDYAIEKLSGKIDHLCDKSTTRIDNLAKESNEHITKLTDRIDKFDKFKWIIIGGALVIGGLFTKFEVLKSIVGL